METPARLKETLETLACGQPLAQLVRIAQVLSERYRKESGSGARLLSGEAEAAVYANPYARHLLLGALGAALRAGADRRCGDEIHP